MAAPPLLSVTGLTVEFASTDGMVRAVSGLDLTIRPGRTLAIVGESGSGKSVTAQAILRLTDYNNGRITAGSMRFQSRDRGEIELATASADTLRTIRGNEIAMIFQEPMTSLNPVFSIGRQIAETIILHRQVSRSEARLNTEALLTRVRLPDAPRMFDRYPHELSGGMRQRVMIAMALCCRPALLIADEPTTALDVTIQAQILNTIRELQYELGTAVIFITHDMGVVAEMADEVAVMHQGRKVEENKVEALFRAPQHPYTQILLKAVPRLGSMAGQPPPARAARGGGDQLLSVVALTKRFPIRSGILRRTTHLVHAVEHVTLSIGYAETLSLVGESGSGKTTLGRVLQQLQAPTSGRMTIFGQDIKTMKREARRQLRQQIQYVFQDPFASLDPRQRVGFSIAEPILTHRLMPSRAAVAHRVDELLEQVGLGSAYARRYPHELSGGQRQRVCIARALSCDPKLVIADEAVSALDVSIQAQILSLLRELQQVRRLSYLFISHDMAVVEQISHRVAVMYMGQIVESGSRAQVFETPRHPYTQRLLAAVPVAEPGRTIDRSLLTGEIPSPVRRVGYAPARNRFEEVAPGHLVAVS